MSGAVYSELHCHSAYSFLDGVSLPEELVQRALELGYESLALTDHNAVAGSMELAVTASALGLRVRHGAEVTLLDGRHLTLLAADAHGWGNLCRILTLAWRDTRQGRVAQEPAVALEDVLAHAGGLVCLSGCARHGVEDEAGVRLLLEAFGAERLRVELQRPFGRHDRAQLRARAALARRLGLRCVATGDVHAHHRCRAELQDCFVALREHTTLEASEPLRRGNHSHVMASPTAMAARFPDHPEAVRETLAVAEMLEFDLGQDLGYRYPGAEDPEAQRRLSELCRARLQERYDSAHRLRREAATRLEEELELIAKLELAGFFLLHHEMLELAREVAVEVRGSASARALLPPGRGRGSSVSSIVCYLTGLSHVDPVESRLALGRFLNEDLQSLPDIDLDFPRDIREQLIPRVHDRFGRDRAALVAAFPTYRSRGAIRELGKVLGLPPGEIERVARGSEGFTPGDWAHGDLPAEMVTQGVAADIACALGPAALRSSRWAWLARLAEEARGLPRHLSQHPGGMIVATRPLIDCCPVVPAAMEGRQMAQWDKDSCADAGFLKIDLLGLGMLSAVERCVELCASGRDELVDLSRVPLDDPETYAAIQAAETVGTFQIESRAQMQSLLRTRPRCLDELVIQVAIVRPGPIQGGAVNPYIKRLQRLRADPSYRVPHLHPTLEPVLAETLGTIIFQDQVMEVAQAFAGFSAGEADALRRAMSRKRAASAVEGFRRRFLEGARACAGAGPELAEEVWEMIAGFAGFGFPKAHSAAFGLLAYQSTWLRVHYPVEFLCSLLNEQPMGFYAPDSLLHEAQRRGIAILPLDVNRSQVECSVELLAFRAAGGAFRAAGGAAGGAFRAAGGGTGPAGGRAVRLGLGYVKGVDAADVQALVAAREQGGPFRDLQDLAARAGAGAGALEQLAWAGACDSLERGGRRAALWALGIAAPGQRVAGGTQLALPLDLPAVPRLRALDRWQGLMADYATSGLTVDGHVLEVLRPRLPAGSVSSAELATLAHGSDVAIAGMVIARQRPGTASGIVFMLIEDERGTANLVVPPAVYERHRAVARAEPLLLARGRLERLPAAGGAINVLVSELYALETVLAPLEEGAHVLELHPEEAATDGVPDEAAEQHDALAVGAEMRAVAPPIMSFAAGRRR